jgi:hypothetical protein
MKALDAVCEVHSSNIEERPTSLVNSADRGRRSWRRISEPVGTNGQSINRHTSERREQSALYLHVYGAIAQTCLPSASPSHVRDSTLQIMSCNCRGLTHGASLCASGPVRSHASIARSMFRPWTSFGSVQALCEEVHSPSLNRSGNGEANRPRGCNNYAGSRCCRRRHRSGDGAVVSLAGAQGVDALRGKRGAPLHLKPVLQEIEILMQRPPRKASNEWIAGSGSRAKLTSRIWSELAFVHPIR